MNTRSEPLCKRAHERVRVTWPVKLGALRGWTRDVSDEGVFLELEEDVGAEADVRFDIDMSTPLGPMHMHCSGRVVRKEPRCGCTGIAVRMTDSRIEVTSWRN